jgi:hypothetical protein
MTQAASSRDMPVGPHRLRLDESGAPGTESSTSLEHLHRECS